MKKLLVSCVMLGILAGCTSPETQPPAKVESRGPDSSGGPTTQPMVENPVSGSPLGDASSTEMPAQRSVYFDFDSSSVKDEYKPVIQAHAQYLSAHRSAKIAIQGNTDKKGSPEYNIALGQRRADGVKQVMLLLGVSESQVETVSFGEEKPRAAGDDEAAYAENRRADVVYQGQ